MLALATFIAATSTPTTTVPAKSSSSGLSLLLPLIVVAAAYFLFLRPRQQRARKAQQASRTAWGVGDRIQSIGGIKGTVLSVDGDDVRVEVDSGVVLTFTARAIQPAPAGTTPTPSEEGQHPEVPGDVDGIDFGDTSAHDAGHPDEGHEGR